MFKKFLVSLIVFSMLVTCCITAQTYAAELKIGAWVGVQPTEAELTAYQGLQQRKLDIVHQFINWSTNFDWVKPYADAVYKNSSTLMITWEPWEYNTADIKDGRADAYITKMAQDIKSYGKEIWLRPLHEANGNWYPWAIGYPGKVNTNDTYKAAFKHIVTIFRNNGVSNVKWVYTVNCSNVGDGTSYTGFYPGDDYVDYTSIDGYNWGTTQSWGSVWQTFDEIFSQPYNALKAIDKPIMIAEWASTEIGGDKAKWISESFNTISASYSRIFAAVWFSENKETDWRINSSSTALEAYRRAVSPAAVKYGDLNNDQEVNSTDFAILKAFLLGIIKDVDRTAADLNADGDVNSTDSAIMKRYILGIITTLPV
ncbi:dockerin type I repeat protein [Anaerobacterium chartisolvens]|uniref:Dockerin type I repeat protein n=1 Tax=Anaerobacterium chartisolvens TaxID=1297424 RepID=A0A369B7A0_9FIRM|nr:dockerin type I domain-containing protein [Anaerobacterium chartisolvens]RCX15554.1 dockerin type I repeat protein [Anaerobacterium chartisolvens]